jgi:hypothetical protein
MRGKGHFEYTGVNRMIKKQIFKYLWPDNVVWIELAQDGVQLASSTVSRHLSFLNPTAIKHSLFCTTQKFSESGHDVDYLSVFSYILL